MFIIAIGFSILLGLGILYVLLVGKPDAAAAPQGSLFMTSSGVPRMLQPGDPLYYSIGLGDSDS